MDSLFTKMYEKEISKKKYALIGASQEVHDPDDEKEFKEKRGHTRDFTDSFDDLITKFAKYIQGMDTGFVGIYELKSKKLLGHLYM